MIYSRIVSSGGYLPQTVKTNDDLAAVIDTSDEWIRTRTGIRQRHFAADDESSVDIGYHAAMRALEDSPYTAQDIDLIVVGTCTPDCVFPSNAVQLQHRLGCGSIPALDVSAACSGFIYALSTADAYIRSGSVKRALVIGSDLFSNSLDWEDRNTAVLFGDGAGAVILEASDNAGIHGFCIRSDGSAADLLIAENGSGAPRSEIDTRSKYIKMQGREVFKVAVKSMCSIVDELLKETNTQADEIDFFIPHQANLRIINAVADHLNIPMERFIVTVDKHANTSAASVPLALDDGIRSGKIQQGQKILLEAFGGGFTWGGCILTY